jgi:enterochelin esterase family protein
LGRRRAGVALAVLVCALAAACGSAPTITPPTPSSESSGASTSPRANASAAPASPVVVETVADLRGILREIGAATPETAMEYVDRLWDALRGDGRVPLVLDDDDVVFLYRGDAETVHWSGSFNGWSEPGLAGTRVGSTDLWIAWTTFPPASRIEYKIVRDGSEWLVDPANPETSHSGLAGATSVLAMPGFTVTDLSGETTAGPGGMLEPAKSITSTHLGYPVAYWVYTPPGYEDLAGLPALYLLDGNDFVDDRMGALPSILDVLIASGRIEPLIAVFVDARDPENPDVNRREEEFLARPVEHARFVAEELVPAIDAAYRTDADADARAVAGVSYGGVSSTFITVAENDTFHALAALSPSLWVIDSPASLSDEAKSAGARIMAERMQVVTACGEGSSPCPRMKVFLSGGLPDWDVGDLGGLAGVLEAQGYAVEFHSVHEGHTWDQWRGLSDEMLTFLFGSP